jgi:hypothetical protein
MLVCHFTFQSPPMVSLLCIASFIILPATCTVGATLQDMAVSCYSSDAVKV